MELKQCSIYRLLVLIFGVNILWIVIAYVYVVSITDTHPILRTKASVFNALNASRVHVIKGKLGAELRSSCVGKAPVTAFYAEGSIVIGVERANLTRYIYGDADIEVWFPNEGWLCHMEVSSPSRQPGSSRLVHVQQRVSKSQSQERERISSAHLVSTIQHSSVDGINARTRSSWMEQWPIGNGKVGALVGGSVFSELLPLSVADFYTAPPAAPPPPPDPHGHAGGDRGEPHLMRGGGVAFLQTNAAKSGGGSGSRFYRRESSRAAGQAGPPGSAASDPARAEEANSPEVQAFHRSRKSLLSGDFESSSRLLSQTLLKEELGRFEALGDLLLLYFPRAPQTTQTTPLRTEEDSAHSSHKPPRPSALRGRSDVLVEFLQAVSSVHLAAPPPRTHKKPQGKASFSGAEAMSSQDSAKVKGARSTASAEPGQRLIDFGSVVHERSFLDTVSGVASSVFVAEAEEVSPTSPPLHIHHREWFASEVDDVLVGTMRCVCVGGMGKEEAEEEEDGGGCLNVHLRLGREVRNTQGGPPGATTPMSEGAWWAGPWRLRRQSLATKGSESEGGGGWLDMGPLLGARGVLLGSEEVQSERLVAFRMSVQPPGSGSGADETAGSMNSDASDGASQEHPGAEVCGIAVCTGSARTHAAGALGAHIIM
jgi:hypothetical protein